MPEQKKGLGCLGAILLIFVVAYIFMSNGSDTKEPSPSQSSNAGFSSVITDGSLQPTAEESSPAQEPTTSPLSSIDTLNGIFRLNLSWEELVPLDDELREDGSSESVWAGLGTVGSALYQPVTIDRYNGETLIVVGSEWSGRPQEQQSSMTIDFYPAALLGYGNRFMLEDVEIKDIEAISGISVSSVNEDPDALNGALRGTGIKLLHCKQKNENCYYLLADSYEQAMGYSILDGTQYIDTSVSMIHPYFAYQEDAPITVPVQITTEGYFTIDISSLSSGYYIIDGLMGNYALIII